MLSWEGGILVGWSPEHAGGQQMVAHLRRLPDTLLQAHSNIGCYQYFKFWPFLWV